MGQQDLAQHPETNNEISVKSVFPGGFRHLSPNIQLQWA
jgi:hypothetical protein